jgi:oligosaccharide repeat unit polymerase
MGFFEIEITRLPLEYWLCAMFLAVSVALAIRQRHELWGPPFIAVLGTIVAWYMVEPLYFEEFVTTFSYRPLSDAYNCLLVFLMTLMILTPVMVRMMRPHTKAHVSDIFAISAEEVIKPVFILWLVLLFYGIYRMDGDVFGALFPIEGRAGTHMWARGAAEDAGASGFLVSTAAYLYVLALSLFGLLLPITHAPRARMFLMMCIAVSWPYALLQGSRTLTLAVITPAVAAYLLLARRSLSTKVLVGLASFFVIDLLMRMIVEFRDVGFGSASLTEIEEAKHLGLNMASELTYVAEFLDSGAMEVSYGNGYLAELMNVVPRVLWPNKPLIGIEYAIARGFGGGQSDIGVVATISQGVVGQGALNFGMWIGPMVAAFLMACWVGILTRLRYQGGAARTGLFLVGLGLTFNLGRGVSLLVLFPFLFGYAFVLFIEAREARRLRAARIRESTSLVGRGAAD